MPLSEYEIKNFETIQQAHEDGNLALLESHRVSDGKRVALICGIMPPTEEDETYNITPFAEMIDGDPFELYEPPFEDDEGDSEPEVGSGASDDEGDGGGSATEETDG
jgi:hypothetical protein